MKIFSSKKKSMGFTLIELLFIIVIIGIVVALTLSAYQQRTTNLKVEQTALQMQQVLQSGISYYNDNYVWPSSSNPPPVFIQSYLPISGTTNPWGQAYQYQGSTTQTNQFQVYSGSLPSAQIASRISSLLPNAGIDPANSTQVIAVVAAAQRSTFDIRMVGVTPAVSDGQTAATFDMQCPTGFTPTIVTAPTQISTETYPPVTGAKWNGHPQCPMGSRPFGQLATTDSCQAPNPTKPNNYQCTITANFNGYIPDWPNQGCYYQTASPVGSGTVAFSYLAYCTQ
jgi:general secretion pathway protein G